MPHVERAGVRLHWDSRGSGSPVLLIMGATYSSAMWWPLLDALSAQHQVISFDNRGTGDSTCTPVASISDMAGDALAVLDAAGVDRAHVYGVSLGGVVAQQFALEFPERVRSLVLGCTGILTADKPRAPKALQLLFRLPRRLRLALGRRGYGPACPPERIAQDQAVLRVERTDRIGLVAQQDALRAYAVGREEIAGLTMPALVLHGTADKLVRLAWGEELAATLPNARLVTYDGAGHNYLVAAGDRANADVLEFLLEVDERSSQSSRP
jgi:pimeloyl-ACP methyl ester carboxylesterase